MENMQLQVIPQVTSGKELTMSSREIADLTGKQHKNIMADIRKMLEEIGELKIQPTYYTNIQGKKQPEYRLPKRKRK